MRHLLAASGFLFLSTLAASAQSGRAPSCGMFQSTFIRETNEVNAAFVRPLVVSRNASRSDFFDLVTNVRIDGLLECQGDTLVRFEVKIGLPSDAATMAKFEQVQTAAVRAALGWAPARATKAVTTMSKEADEYLRASSQRGDVVVAGKTEYHEGGADLGMIWTPRDRTLVIVGSGI
ncbi:MAG: hypothetical protein JWN07_338 [Hyphomicrobiales bacterium]|nr:hypothetical protein [Hyphomicrobiales bacterium]